MLDRLRRNCVHSRHRTSGVLQRMWRRAKGKKNRHFTLRACLPDKFTKARQERELQEVLHGIMKGFSECQFQDMEEAEEWVRAQAGRAHAGLFKVTPGRGGGRNPGEKFARSRDGGFCLGVAERAYAAMVKNFGIFMILNSDAKASGEQTLLDNKSRDCQEKIFDILKNATGNDRLRISGDDSLEGRLFIAFLAVALHKMVENKLRKAELLNTMTVNKAMDSAEVRGRPVCGCGEGELGGAAEGRRCSKPSPPDCCWNMGSNPEKLAGK